MYIEQLNDPEAYDCMMAGWFAVVDVNKDGYREVLGAAEGISGMVDSELSYAKLDNTIKQKEGAQMKNAEEFFKDLKENKELADGLMAVLTLAKQESEDEAMAQILRFANENGYEIQAKDLKIKSGTELSDEELELVGGGGFLSRLTQFCLRNIVGPENVIKI